MATIVQEDWEKSLIEELYSVGVWKFGKFTLKTGLVTPIYIDLRFLVAYPNLLKKIGTQIWNRMEREKIQYDSVCGVPYAALPFASVVSFSHDIPMLIRRKEAKHYGTARLIEGILNKNQKSLIIEDVVVFGHSVLETVKVLREHNLTVTDAVVVFNREQGAENLLKSSGIKLHSILTLNRTLDYFLKTGKISRETFNEVTSFINANNVAPPIDEVSSNVSTVHQSFPNRIGNAKHRQLQRLYEIMMKKKTNICLAADFTDSDKILNLVSTVGLEICLLKLHSDMINDFSVAFVEKIKILSEDLNFLIIEDRQFCDTGLVAVEQLVCKVLDIPSWAHFVTVHSVVGSSIFDCFRQICAKKNIAILIAFDPNFKEALSENDDDTYVSYSSQLAQNNSDIVAGFISTNKRIPIQSDNFVHLASNLISNKSMNNSNSTNCCSPEEAITLNGNDVIIVGHELLDFQNNLPVIQQYKSTGWKLLMG